MKTTYELMHKNLCAARIDTATNRPVSLHPLMEFNRTFGAYDTPDGANCQPEFPNRITQRAAAEKAVRSIGLNHISEVKREWFDGRESDCEMFFCRLEILKNALQN